MTSVEFIKQICKEKNIPISRLEHDLGFSNGYIRNMANRTLSADRAAKIAEYLNVPVEQIIRPCTTPPEAPVSRQASTMAPIMLELIQNASEANIEDIAMASDMLKRLNAYRCAKRYSSGGLRRCTNTKVMREHILEKYLLDNIRPLIKDLVLQYKVKQKPQRNAKKQIEKLEKKKTRLKDLYLSGMITLDEYKTDRESIDTQIASVTPKNAPKCHDTTLLEDFIAKDIESLYGDFRADEKRYLWRSVIKEIRFDKNRNIEIIFLP